jgi:AraC-like DNA-binding protein
MSDNNNNDLLALQEAYANVYNEIVKPDRVFVATQYFRKKWVPLLGASLAWVIISLRQHCYWNKETGEKRDWCLISQEELASETGISVATLKRLFKHEYADKFILKVTHRYRYDRKMRKQVRKKSMYRIRMDDPLTPEDEVRLKELVTQKLVGLNIDPETGQIDVLEVLDRLSATGLDDLQLKLSDRQDGQDQVSGQDEISPSVNELADQVGRLLTGSDGLDGASDSEVEPEIPFPTAIQIQANELRRFELGPDQVLIEWQGTYLAAPIIEVVKQDLRLSGGRPTDQTRTECFFSVADALDEVPEDWLPEEQARIHLMQRLERELGETYRRLDAFSLEEALSRYFNPSLLADFLTDQSPEGLERIESWLIYTRQAKSLKNPGGFLRSRIESSEWPPEMEPST